MERLLHVNRVRWMNHETSNLDRHDCGVDHRWISADFVWFIDVFNGGIIGKWHGRYSGYYCGLQTGRQKWMVIDSRGFRFLVIMGTMKINGSTIVWIIVTITVSIVAIVFLKRHFHEVNQIIRALGIFGPLISLCLYAVLALTPVSTDPISVINVIIFGPIFGTLITAGGNTIGATVEYMFGRHLGHTTRAKEYLDNLPLGLNKIKVDSVWFLIGGRLLPGYGTKLVSVLAGIRHVSVTRYIWTTLVTNSIGAVVIALGSHGLKAIISLRR
jgi:uncharacterized membrane protein YdjX (TVP38/TMEM64 family)